MPTSVPTPGDTLALRHVSARADAWVRVGEFTEPEGAGLADRRQSRELDPAVVSFSQMRKQAQRG